jgi:hypothetical protein
MNVERGLRRLLITISGLLVVAGAVVGAGLSTGPIFCTYTVRLSDGTVVEIRARYYAMPEDVAAVALRLQAVESLVPKAFNPTALASN